MRVLFATDGSPDAVRAAEFLSGFPLPEGSTTWVLSVAAMPNTFAAGDHDDVKESLRSSARQIGERARATLAERPGATEVIVLDSEPGGDCRDAIIDAAEVNLGAGFCGSRTHRDWRSLVVFCSRLVHIAQLHMP